MDARPPHPSMEGRSRQLLRSSHLVVVLAAVMLLSACSSNNDAVGPKHTAGGPAQTTGFANTAADIRVVVGINPNSITPGQRAGVTAFVTNLNGQPLAGKRVQFSTTVGTLDQTVGVTNAAGQFSTTLRITPADAQNTPGGSATVTAFVEGATGVGTVTFGANATLVLIPSTTTQTNVADGGGDPPTQCTSVGGFTVNFTVSGGVPPYRFNRAGSFPGSSISGSGVYTVPLFGPIGVGGGGTDSVTVTDARGTTASATVTIECVEAP